MFAMFALVPWLPSRVDGPGGNSPSAAVAAKDRLVLKVYQVVDLLVPSPNYPYRGADLPTTGGPQSYRAGAQSFGSSGSGGGGFFQVPPERSFLAQRGKSGTAGGQAESEGMASGGVGSEPPGSAALRFGIEDLVDAIIAVVAPNSWDELGGPGTIRPLGSMLLVSQTEDSTVGSKPPRAKSAPGGRRANRHGSRRWLALDDAQRAQLTPESSGKSAVAVDSAALKKLPAETTRHQGQVTCHSGQTVHIVSGTRHTVVTSAIPVVGGPGTGYQPVVAFPNAGVLLQVTPLILPGGQAASLDVQSTVTAWQTPESVNVSDGGTSLSIDRVRLAANQIATTVRIPVGKPVLVGGLTPSDADASQKTLYLVVELTSDDEMTPVPRDK